MIRLMRSILASAVAVATLGACHHDEKATGHGTVSGEILPGSVSDAMLPYDSVKSKAPLAPVQSAGEPGNGSGDNAADSADTTAAAADSAVADSAASPSPAAPVVTN